jgi:hypothetical protein
MMYIFVVNLFYINNKEFRFFLIGLNSIFSTLPQSEYTSRACVYFCLLSIPCFNVVQRETGFHFQSANQIAKKGPNYQKFLNFTKFKKNSKISYISKFSKKFQNCKIDFFSKVQNFSKISTKFLNSN